MAGNSVCIFHLSRCNTIMLQRTFFGGGGGGGEILREISDQDQCEHMLNLVMVIARA